MKQSLKKITAGTLVTRKNPGGTNDWLFQTDENLLWTDGFLTRSLYVRDNSIYITTSIEGNRSTKTYLKRSRYAAKAEFNQLVRDVIEQYYRMFNSQVKVEAIIKADDNFSVFGNSYELQELFEDEFFYKNAQPANVSW